MEKFTGRFYVSMLIIAAAMDASIKAFDSQPLWWFVVAAHLGCLFFVVRDGVQ